MCCEAYKFHERVQLDSITHNELGDPGELAALPPGVVASAGVPTGVGRSALTLIAPLYVLLPDVPLACVLATCGGARAALPETHAHGNS